MKRLRGLFLRLILLLLITAVCGCAAGKQVIREEGAAKPPEEPSAQAPQAPAPGAAAAPRAEKPPPQAAAEAPAPPAGPVSPPPPSARPPAKAPEPARSRFVLNFDNADLYEVIRVMAQMMKINYIIDPRVKGVVNIHTSGQISGEEILPIFQSILKLNGATAVQRGSYYEIVPFGEAKKLYTPPTAGKDPQQVPEEEKYTIQIVSLKYIPAGEVAKMIKPFLSDGADIVEHGPQNVVIIGDSAANVRKSLDIIGLFDTDIFTDMRVRIYPVLNADVNEVAKEMERIFTSFEVSLKSGRGVGITFTPIMRINSLLAVSSIPNIFEKVEKWLKELDRVPGTGMKISVFVYYVQNGKAKDMAEVLKQIYAPKKTEQKTGAAPTPPAPGVPSSQQRLVRPAAPAEAPHPTEAGAVPEGEIGIVVDETTNSLIIRAYQRDYRNILETVKKLDLYPKQVLIEVLLAEVTLDDAYKYGLEFSTFQDSFVRGDRTYGYTIGMGGVASPATFTSGLRYTLAATDKLTAAIHASAINNRLKVISSPHVLASNNKEAKIQIGESRPILTNTYTTTATGTPGVVEGTIEYKDIGIILTVTPRISDGGLVSLDINVENSSVDFAALGNLNSVPFFKKKTAKTTLSILEGQTIVIGGLIEDSKTDNTSGVPFLSRIPILGALFGYKTYEKTKTETLLLMTPHVITNLEESTRITQEFREKVWAIKQEVEKREKQRKEERENP